MQRYLWSSLGYEEGLVEILHMYHVGSYCDTGLLQSNDLWLHNVQEFHNLFISFDEATLWSWNETANVKAMYYNNGTTIKYYHHTTNM